MWSISHEYMEMVGISKTYQFFGSGNHVDKSCDDVDLLEEQFIC